MYQIHSKHIYGIQPKFELDKFMTGGKIFLSFKQAQETKKKLQKMNSSFKYKVIKLND